MGGVYDALNRVYSTVGGGYDTMGGVIMNCLWGIRRHNKRGFIAAFMYHLFGNMAQYTGFIVL